MILMVGRACHDQMFAVEKESFVRIKTNCADAEACFIRIHDLSPGTNDCSYLVQVWRLCRPQSGIHNVDMTDLLFLIACAKDQTLPGAGGNRFTR